MSIYQNLKDSSKFDFKPEKGTDFIFLTTSYQDIAICVVLGAILPYFLIKKLKRTNKILHVIIKTWLIIGILLVGFLLYLKFFANNRIVIH